MADLHCWKIVLKVRGPALTTSSAPMGFGIDAPFARNAAGEYYLAGSLVKGRLKESWRELEDTLGQDKWNWQQWIGKEPPEQGAEDWDSERGLLQFTDFTFAPANSSQLQTDVITYRIERDRDTRAVKRGQNLMIDTPFGPGGEYSFEGRIWGVVDKKTAQNLDTRLAEGLCYTPAVGAETTVGFGVITAVSVSRVTAWEQGSGFERTDGDRWGLALRPEGPLCLSGRRLADNIFESEPQISGGVIKGALATLIQRIHGLKGRDISEHPPAPCRELCEDFSKLHVLHAKPVLRGTPKRPGTVPLSAVKTGRDAKLQDVALRGNLQLVDGYAPSFQVDWKNREDAEQAFSIVRPVYELRVRTQIETEKRHAKENNLFAYRMLAPRATAQSGVREFEWLAEIDFTAIADKDRRAKVQAQLANLLRENGLLGVGKLKTRCIVDRIDSQPAVPPVSNKNGTNLWVLTLQTPALMCDVAAMGAGLSDAKSAYVSYWDEASQGSLKLERFYAAQSLAGGGYLWNQFRATRPYRPYILTQEGSTFVLSGVTENAGTCIALWQRRGLPVAASVCEKFQLRGDAGDWRHCPYVPENGYGEIAVDLAWHWERTL